MTENREPSEDNFEISLRVLGNEILGMQLKSASRMRNWAAFGIIALLVILALTAELLPAIMEAVSQ